MAGSSEKINYNIRTSKSIERKMMCEMIGCMGRISNLSEYRYIGFGAKFFTDFILMHKQFGISEMYSLETKRSEETKARFEFNKPYNCITMRFQNSTEWLNSTDFGWKKKNDIIWLDYDGGFDSVQLQDIGLCVNKVRSKSFIFLSSNISFLNGYFQKNPEEKKQIFCDKVNNAAYTRHLKTKDFAAEGIYSVIADTFNLVVSNAISEHNRVVQNDSKKMNADQIVYFTYSDSMTPMITLGWIVYNEFDREAVMKCEMQNKPFFNGRNKPYNINVPNLTYKEIAILNKNMPEYTLPIKDAEFFTEKEVEEYRKIYRYYPTTIETNIVL